MIIVVGLPAYTDAPDGERCAGGLVVDLAAAARRRGSTVELVGKVGSDGAGDAVVVALGRMGVGHAALLRDPVLPTPILAPSPTDDDAAEVDADSAGAQLLPGDPSERPALEAADIDLALKFLPHASVIVLAEPLPEEAVSVAVDGAAFAAARLVVLVAAGAAAFSLPVEATVLETPAADDGSFGRLVGTYAGALDAGVEPSAAFAEAVAASGWEPIAE